MLSVRKKFRSTPPFTAGQSRRVLRNSSFGFNNSKYTLASVLTQCEQAFGLRRRQAQRRKLVELRRDSTHEGLTRLVIFPFNWVRVGRGSRRRDRGIFAGRTEFPTLTEAIRRRFSGRVCLSHLASVGMFVAFRFGWPAFRYRRRHSSEEVSI
jgi:hypothetical protein